MHSIQDFELSKIIIVPAQKKKGSEGPGRLMWSLAAYLVVDAYYF
jgi:hypothetical protein